MAVSGRFKGFQWKSTKSQVRFKGAQGVFRGSYEQLEVSQLRIRGVLRDLIGVPGRIIEFQGCSRKF